MPTAQKCEWMKKNETIFGVFRSFVVYVLKTECKGRWMALKD